MLSKKKMEEKRRDNFFERVAEIMEWESYEQPAAHKLKSLAPHV